MWVQLIEKQDIKDSVDVAVKPRPPAKFQLRLIIWDTKGVKC